MSENVRNEAAALVTQLREAAAYKRAITLDPSKGKSDYDAAQDEWGRIYRLVFAAIAKNKLLHMLQFLDEQKQSLGDDAYYAGIAKLIMGQED